MSKPAENPLARRLDRSARAVAIVAGWALLGLSALIGVEVAIRKLFNASLQGADEFGGYVVAVTAGFGAALALLDRAHTRIEIFVAPLPAGVRAMLNALAMVSMAALAAFLAWRGLTTLQDSVAYQSLSGTPLRTPLWLPQTAWVIGLFVFAGVALAAAAHAMATLVRDPSAVNRWYGAKSLSEEIEEERGSLRRRGGEGGSR